MKARTIRRSTLGLSALGAIALLAPLAGCSNAEKEKMLQDQNQQLQVEKAASDTAKARAESALATALKRADTAEAEAEQAKKEESFQSQPEVTVTLSFGKPGWFSSESGSVVRIHNPYADSVALTATVKRSSDGKTKAYEFVIDGGATKEIGESEGWAFISGDTVTINQDKHKPATWTMD